MTIIFLAGGEGKRMKPFLTPKPLIPFFGEPISKHVLNKLKSLPIEKFIIISSPSTKQAFDGIAQDLGIQAEVVVQAEPKGMADAILSVKNSIAGKTLIVNAEDLIDLSAYQGVIDIAQNDADVVFCGLQVQSYFPGGYFRLEGDKVTGIIEKPGEGNEPSNLIKLVLDYFKDGQLLVKALEQASSDKDDLYEVALDKLINSDLQVEVSRYSGPWSALKYPWHILDQTNYLLQRLQRSISPNAQIAEKAIIEGQVVIEDGVKVFEGAVIKGPAFIGQGSIIGNSALVRESIIEENSIVGFDTEIARSYIGKKSWFHKNYVGDSVIEGDFEMGSGAITANLRLDGKEIKVGEERIKTHKTKLGLIAGRGVRIGCNSTIQPGIRVGSNSLIGSGVVVSRDIKENTKLTLKQEYQVSEFSGDDTDYSQFKDKLK